MCVHDGRSTKPLPEKEISREHRFQNRNRNVGRSERQFCSAQKEKDRWNYVEDRAFRESCDQLVAVSAFDVQHGETGLPILWERRPAALVPKATGRPLPRLLQEALRLGPERKEDHSYSEDEGRQVVYSRFGNELGLGLIR
jgi:hypothetical protein